MLLKHQNIASAKNLSRRLCKVALIFQSPIGVEVGSVKTVLRFCGRIQTHSDQTSVSDIIKQIFQQKISKLKTENLLIYFIGSSEAEWRYLVNLKNVRF